MKDTGRKCSFPNQYPAALTMAVNWYLPPRGPWPEGSRQKGHTLAGQCSPGRCTATAPNHGGWRLWFGASQSWLLPFWLTICSFVGTAFLILCSSCSLLDPGSVPRGWPLVTCLSPLMLPSSWRWGASLAPPPHPRNGFHAGVSQFTCAAWWLSCSPCSHWPVSMGDPSLAKNNHYQNSELKTHPPFLPAPHSHWRAPFSIHSHFC